MILERWVFQWFTIADGTAELCLGDGHQPEMIGILDRLETVPHPTDAPNDNYDVYLYDRLGNDLLHGCGANRDTANAETAAIYRSLGTTGHVYVPVSGWSRFRVENAGAYHGGIAIIYLFPPAGRPGSRATAARPRGRGA